MKKPECILPLLFLVTILSTSPYSAPEKVVIPTGTYGVCGCGAAAQDSPRDELTLREDGSFHYVNDFNPSKRIDVTGEWVADGKQVQLDHFTSAFPVHDKWKMDKSGKCLESRKGLEFVRLCHLQDCK